MAVLNFLIIALVLFLIVKAMNSLHDISKKLTEKEEAEEEPTVKACPYCKTETPVEATRCPHCTSQLEE